MLGFGVLGLLPRSVFFPVDFEGLNFFIASKNDGKVIALVGLKW